jgi:HPt (histidine-containing phosphotransfer) domain-containing protein
MAAAPGQIVLDDLLRVCSSGDQINRELLKEMLLLFIDENARRVGRAVAAADQDDLDTLRCEAHAIKGSAAIVGAENLRNLAIDLELRILSGAIRNPRLSAQQVSNEFDAVVRNLRRLYPDLGSASRPVA